MKKNEPKTKKIGRDASSGKFIPVEKAKQNPKTTEVETVPIGRKSAKSSKPKK